MIEKAGKISKLWMSLVLLIAGMLFFDLGETQAATSYTNAKEFYESTAQNGEYYHAEVYNGNIYYATCAKLASGSTNLKYGTVGYDICLTANGQAVSFRVKRNGDGSMQEVSGSRVEDNGYAYNLYCIPAEKILALAKNSNAAGYEVVSSGSVINIRIDAIMTTHRNGTYHGGVSETGGWSEWGTIYHLKEEAELKAIKKVFSGHTFISFYDIKEDLQNYQLSICYVLKGGTVANGYSSVDDVLYKNSAAVITQARVLQTMQLVSPQTIALSKTGYYLPNGKEWTRESRNFSPTTVYMPKDIESGVGTDNRKIYMYANWQPITYTVQYDTNGGEGIFAGQLMTYDNEYRLRGKSTRTGYKFMGWKKDSGTIYDAGTSVKNLADVDSAVVTLTAAWEPDIYKITTDKQGGTGGTEKFYEKYNTDWYSNEKAARSLVEVEPPTRMGYTFHGYWTGLQKAGYQIIDKDGKITADPDRFVSNATIYACWEPANYTITLKKQGGTGGTSKVTATYGEALPDAAAPTRTGYSFKGYYTEKSGAGTLYYDENMIEQLVYQETDNIILYAYWVDDIEPTAKTLAEPGIWTNGSQNMDKYGVQCVYIHISAADGGSGLKSITLKDRNGKTVKTWSDLGGAKTKTCKYQHSEEGLEPYTVVVKDKKGNTAEAKTVAYYDVTVPKSGITTENQENYIEDDGTYITISPFFVTDY